MIKRNVYAKKKYTDNELDQQIEKLNKKLLNFEQRVCEIQKLAKIGNWEWDVEQQLLLWSDEVYRIFGLDPESFKPSVESFESTIHPDDLNDFLKQRESMLNEKREACIDHRIVLPDGRIRYVQERTQLITNKQKEVCRIIGTVQDISKRKQAEEQLRKSEYLIKSIINASQDIIAFKDINFIFRLANPAMCKLVGKSENSILGKTDFDIFTHKMAKKYRQDDQKVIESGIPISIDEKVIEADKIRFVSTTKAPVFNEKYETTGVVIIVRDITKQKKAEAEREKLISELQESLAQVKILKGLLPICSFCKNIRNDKGYWDRIESYIQKHSHATFTHSICPDCVKKHYPELNTNED